MTVRALIDLLEQQDPGRRAVNVRSWLYALARLMGDVNAVQKNRVPQRIGRRIAGRLMSRLLNRLFR